jgi:uncharacterized protein YbcC (UPF0753/DUF2309 family)
MQYIIFSGHILTSIFYGAHYVAEWINYSTFCGTSKKDDEIGK